MVEELWGMAARWAGKCVPRWADLDQASSGDPEPPEEVAEGNELEVGREMAKRKSYLQSCSGG